MAWTSAHTFSPDELVQAAAFAHLASSGLEKASLLHEAKDAKRRLGMLVESDHRLMFVVDGHGTIAQVGRAAGQVLGYDQSDLLGKPLQGLVARVPKDAASGRQENVGYTVSEVQELVLSAKDGHSVSVEVLPTAVQGIEEPGEIWRVVRDTSHRKLLELELSKRNVELSLVNALATSLSQSLDLDEVLQLGVNTVAETTKHRPVLIALVDEQLGQLVVRSHCNAPDRLIEDLRHVKLGEGISGRVAVTGEPICVPNIAADARSTSIVPYAHQYKNRSFVCVPLKFTNKVIGTISVVSKRFHVFTADDVQLFMAIGHLVGSAVERTRMHEAMVLGYNDRLALMRDELRLLAHAQERERLRVAQELRTYFLDQLANEKAMPKSLSKAFGALTALAQEMSASVEGASLPSLLEEAVRWRSTHDPSGRVLRLVWDSWPDDVPSDIIAQLYSIVIGLLARLKELSPGVGLTIRLFENDRVVGMRFSGLPRVARSETRTADGIDWELLEIADVERIATSLGAKVRVDTAAAGGGLTVSLPRYWDQVPKTKRTTLLIVNDQPLYGQAMASLLERQESIHVVGVAQGTQEGVALTRRLSPDVIIVDISPPSLRGIDVTRAIRQAFPSARILIVTPDQGPTVVEGLLAGATGFVPKASTPVDLLRAINSLLQADPTLTREAAERALALLGPGKGMRNQGSMGHRLTPREIDILKLIAAGKTSKQICRMMRITDKTVRRHISNMYQKLQIFDRAQLVLYAARKGLIDLEGATTDETPALGGEEHQ